MSINFRKAEFVRSAASERDFPNDDRPRIVFAGRSNVGKSSTINRIVDHKGFARVSSMPGKTVFVNLFLLDKALWLVDLPGYGYSKTSKQERARYSALIESYFSADRGNIARLFMIVDARHEPTDDDILMARWAVDYGAPITVIANKLDKLKKSQIDGSIAQIRQTLGLGIDVKVIPFSAEKGTNKEMIFNDVIEALGE